MQRTKERTKAGSVPLRGLTRTSVDYPRRLLVPQTLLSGDLCILGDVRLLCDPTLGVLSSRRVPGRLIREAHDWAEHMKLFGGVIVGGFHSPMERECLNVLLVGRTRLVICPPRGIGRIRVPVAWRPLIDAGRIALVSAIEPEMRRSTEALAARRNALVASLVDSILIVHASVGSATEKIAKDIVRHGKKLVTFGGPENDRLIRIGAEAWSWEDFCATHGGNR